MRWEHGTAVLTFKEKVVAVRSRGILEGLSDESADVLRSAGREGWELVAVIPFTSGGGIGTFTSAKTKTDNAMAFFKRPLVETEDDALELDDDG